MFPTMTRRAATALLLVLGLALPVLHQAQPLDLSAPPLTPLAEDGIHDPYVESIDALQDPTASMKDFPTDRRGEVDWVRALREGVIDPRKSVTDDEWEHALMKPMDLDILMKNTAEMPW